MTSRVLTIAIVACMVLGALLGIAVHAGVSDPASVKAFAENVALLTTIFLRLIRMIIAPLVFSSLVAAIARMGGAAEIGRVGIKAMTWFIGASCVSLLIG